MLTFVISFFVAVLATPLVINLYRKCNWLDQLHQKHVKQTHTTNVPRGGGVVVATSVILISLVLLQLDYQLLAILFGALVLGITGFLDDLYDIHPGWRLLANFIAAGAVVGSGIGIDFVTNPITIFNPQAETVLHLDSPKIIISLFGFNVVIRYLADVFGMLFIMWNINIVNWSKGVDGQLPSFVTVAAIMIGIVSYRFIGDPAQMNTAQLAFIVAGTYAGYLYWNWYPQKTMPGYGGGSLAGYFLSVLAMLAGAKLATTLMVLAVPTADAIFTILRRLRAGKSPIWGDRGHLHHKLLDVLGWGRRRIALFYTGSSLLLGFIALYASTFGKILTLLVTFSLVFSFLIWAKLKQPYIVKK